MLSLRSPRARWAVPGIGAAIVAAALVVTPLVAGAAPALPPRTAAELLASTRAAVDHPFSGTVVQTARLGLPDLPRGGHGRSTSLSLTSLITGSHTAQVWYAAPDRSRLLPQLLLHVRRGTRANWGATWATSPTSSTTRTA